MLKLVERVTRTGYLYSLKVAPHKLPINYKGKGSGFTVQKASDCLNQMNKVNITNIETN